MSKSPQPVQMPGAGNTDDMTPEQRRIAELEAQVEQLEISKRAAIAKTTPEGAPFEPVTQHGAAEIAASQHRQWTSAQVTEMIRTGQLPNPGRAVLCSDGWLALWA